SMPTTTTFEDRRRLERMSADALAEHQLRRLNQLFAAILPQNAFYAGKLSGHLDLAAIAGGAPALRSLEDLSELPFTFKEDLIDPHHPSGPAANLTYPRKHYVRLHQTSGTHGRPLTVLDTSDDWTWWLDCWQFILDAAEIRAGDCVVMAFSFGPFVGFWSAF